MADALDGRNLFPGGGSLSLSATGSGAFSEESDTLWQLFGFYFRPLNSRRPDQPNRVLPVGDFMGVHGSVAVPLGLWLVWPALDVMREASHTVTESAGVTDRVDGSGWTTNVGVQVTLPVPGRVDVTPGIGVVRGSLDASVTSTTRGIASQDSFSDPIRGWWASLELSGRF